jgi:hypothetical protein
VAAGEERETSRGSKRRERDGAEARDYFLP